MARRGHSRGGEGWTAASEHSPLHTWCPHGEDHRFCVLLLEDLDFSPSICFKCGLLQFHFPSVLPKRRPKGTNLLSHLRLNPTDGLEINPIFLTHHPRSACWLALYGHTLPPELLLAYLKSLRSESPFSLFAAPPNSVSTLP